jgi:hypothetical protein
MPKNNLIIQYRRVFSSTHGIDVLNHILFDLGTFTETSDSSEDVALKNYGLRLLKILGGGEPQEDTMKVFTMQLMKQILEKETPDE